MGAEALNAAIKVLEGAPLPADQDPVTRELEWYVKLFFGVHFADNLA